MDSLRVCKKKNTNESKKWIFPSVVFLFVFALFVLVSVIAAGSEWKCLPTSENANARRSLAWSPSRGYIYYRPVKLKPPCECGCCLNYPIFLGLFSVFFAALTGMYILAHVSEQKQKTEAERSNFEPLLLEIPKQQDVTWQDVRDGVNIFFGSMTFIFLCISLWEASGSSSDCGAYLYYISWFVSLPVIVLASSLGLFFVSR